MGNKDDDDDDDTHCCITFLSLHLLKVSTQTTEMRVPNLPMSPSVSRLVLLLLLIPLYYSHIDSHDKPHAKRYSPTDRGI